MCFVSDEIYHGLVTILRNIRRSNIRMMRSSSQFFQGVLHAGLRVGLDDPAAVDDPESGNPDPESADRHQYAVAVCRTGSIRLSVSCSNTRPLFASGVTSSSVNCVTSSRSMRSRRGILHLGQYRAIFKRYARVLQPAAGAGGCCDHAGIDFGSRWTNYVRFAIRVKFQSWPKVLRASDAFLKHSDQTNDCCGQSRVFTGGHPYAQSVVMMLKVFIRSPC